MLKVQLQDRHFPFWLFSYSVLIALTLPTLIRDGMFMDAVLYTSVSHNLSIGIGTFWFPQFSLHNVGGLNSFHEQPPLVFGIQAVFFRIFGDSLYVERLYTFITTCLSAYLINLLWKENFHNNIELKKLGWLPVILWITIPICFWSYSNNMHENTMGIFTLSSTLFIYHALKSSKSEIIKCFVGGLFIFLATLSKGLPGFFPLAVPFLYWLFVERKKISRIIFYTFLIALIPLIMYVVLFNIPESRESLSNYLFKRALFRINENPTVDNRFFILFRLLTELLPQISLLIIFILIAKIKNIKNFVSENLHRSTFFITIGLSASAPIMLTMIQKGFYFVPALPYFAIGFATLLAPIINNLINRLEIPSKKFRGLLLSSFSIFILSIAFSFLQIGKFSRNKDLLNDVYIIGKLVPRQTVVSIPEEIWNEWDLQCYLMRYFNISLEINYDNNYCIDKKSIIAKVLPNYKRIDNPTSKYDLYEKMVSGNPQHPAD